MRGRKENRGQVYEQQTEIKYICVKFIVDDNEMVPFPDFFFRIFKTSYTPTCCTLPKYCKETA
jgi:hypothetical protein